MKKQIVINASKDRSRIAIVENDELVELYVENPDNVRTIGNVYLGSIQKVMPAIRAAFVDVGQKQDCFLHFSDLTDNLPQLLALAGEDVPGLNEPVLSLAPAKRVADDDDEPDVEDALEVEAAEPESVTKGRSRRRSRGRGRSRRGASRPEEEEEQEEAGEGRRRLPGVIDLSSPSSRRPAPRPALVETAEEEPEEEVPLAEVETTAEAEEAPTPKPRKSRAKKAAPVGDSAEAEDVTEAAESTASTDAEAETPEATPKPKRKRRRSRGGAANAAADAEAPDADAAADEVETPADAEAEDAPKPRARTSRAKKAAPKADADAAPEAAEEEETPTPRARKSRAKKAAPAEDAADAPEEAPTPKPRKSRAKKATPATAAPTEDTDDPSGAVSPTGRSRRPATPASGGSSDAAAPVEADAPAAPVEADAPAGAEEATPSRTKRLPSTLDLTSAATKPARSRPAPADDDVDDADDDQPAGRSRRRSRGAEKAVSADPADTEADAPEADADGTSSRRSRSGRGRSRSSSDDADGRSRRGGRSSQEKASDDDSADSEGSSRGRRGGRSGDATGAEAKESRGRDNNGSGRDGNGRDSNGSGRDRSGGGRSSSGRSSSGRSSDRASGARPSSGPIPPNEELLRRSGKIIVKITKEAISTKGPRVSTDLSLAGRFLVLVPAADYVAVSKKIESAKERRRLRALATSLKPDRFGVIVRTVAEGRDAKSLDTDLRLLVDKWRKIEQKLNENPEPPILLYQDVNMVSSVIRDLFSEDYDRILVDDPKVFKNVQAYVKAVAPQMADKVELHPGRTPVFRSLGIEKQVEEAFSKRVNMKGGGYLYIETTEAMHVVDVNSGRAGRGKSQKQNLIDVNVEAAREVAKQLRLRDLGGIIVVDFIDLKYDRDRKKVTDVLKEAFAKDRAVTKLLPMSDFGLVQITRQRLRPSITTQATDENGDPLDAADAAEAAGAGEIRRHGQAAYAEPEYVAEPAERPALSPEDASPLALAGRLRGWLDHYRQTVDEKYKRRPIVVRVHPLFGGYLRRGFPSPQMRWRLSLRGINFVLEDDVTVDPLTFDVRDQKSGRSLVKKYSV